MVEPIDEQIPIPEKVIAAGECTCTCSSSSSDAAEETVQSTKSSNYNVNHYDVGSEAC